MNRRKFLECSAAAAVSRFPGHSQTNVFPYRGWSFCVHTYDWEMLESYVDAALGRVREYGINTFELHDYTIGRRGLVDASVQYAAFPKLAAKSSLRYGSETCAREQREADYVRLRTLARKIKSHGLKLNCWYHVMRDAPAELFTEYPQINNLDSGFYFEYLDQLLREFYERLPEVDRLTITSLHETPSVFSSDGSSGREQRLLKLYQTLYSATRRAGKELIIRDFIVNHNDFSSFWSILSKLPADVHVMTKEVLADWIHLDMPVNPFLSRYRGRSVIVEFDLYGEYWGRLGIPACYPEYIHRQIRNIRAFDPMGAVGRVVHDNQRSDVFATIFDSPNEVNCYAFAKLISQPLPWLGANLFTDRREKPGRWGWDLDAFDKKLWMTWASKRYGPRAAVSMIRALSRTDQILSLTIGIGGRGFQAHSHVPGMRSLSFLWEPFTDQVKALGMDFIRDEKQQALALARATIEDIRGARSALDRKDYAALISVFEGELMIIRSYEAVLEGYYQVFLGQRQSGRKELRVQAQVLRHLASDIASARSERFFGSLPDTLRQMAAWVEAGVPPRTSSSS